jgi:hypothetical protein
MRRRDARGERREAKGGDVFEEVNPSRVVRIWADLGSKYEVQRSYRQHRSLSAA